VKCQLPFADAGSVEDDLAVFHWSVRCKELLQFSLRCLQYATCSYAVNHKFCDYQSHTVVSTSALPAIFPGGHGFAGARMYHEHVRPSGLLSLAQRSGTHCQTSSATHCYRLTVSVASLKHSCLQTRISVHSSLEFFC